MPTTGKPTPDEASQVPYDPESGVLKEAKWVEDEERFLEAVGALDEEEHQAKLKKLEEGEYEDAYQEYLRDAFRSYIIHKRIQLGQVSSAFLQEHNKYIDAGDLSNMCYDRERKATAKLSIEEWDSKYYETTVNAKIDFYSEVFPGLPTFIGQKIAGKEDVKPKDIVLALDAYLDGEDLPKPIKRSASL